MACSISFSVSSGGIAGSLLLIRSNTLKRSSLSYPIWVQSCVPNGTVIIFNGLGGGVVCLVIFKFLQSNCFAKLLCLAPPVTPPSSSLPRLSPLNLSLRQHDFISLILFYASFYNPRRLNNIVGKLALEKYIIISVKFSWLSDSPYFWLLDKSP